MSQHESLNNFELFLEKIDTPEAPILAPDEPELENDYDTAKLCEDQVSKLSEDLLAPINQADKSTPLSP